MNKEDEKEKETHLELNNILDLDTPQLEHRENKLALNNNEKLKLDKHDGMSRDSEIELKRALDLLKSLKPNEVLIKAIELIEGVIKREQE